MVDMLEWPKCLLMNFLTKLNIQSKSNKAGYTAQDAPSTRLKITGDGRTDGRTDEHNLLKRCDGASKKMTYLIVVLMYSAFFFFFSKKKIVSNYVLILMIAGLAFASRDRTMNPTTTKKRIIFEKKKSVPVLVVVVFLGDGILG